MLNDVTPFIGHVLNVAGELLIAYTAIMVHHRFLKEHKIDKRVFSEMKKEQFIGVSGVVLLIVGFLLELPARWPFL